MFRKYIFVFHYLIIKNNIYFQKQPATSLAATYLMFYKGVAWHTIHLPSHLPKKEKRNKQTAHVIAKLKEEKADLVKRESFFINLHHFSQVARRRTLARRGTLTLHVSASDHVN